MVLIKQCQKPTLRQNISHLCCNCIECHSIHKGSMQQIIIALINVCLLLTFSVKISTAVWQCAMYLTPPRHHYFINQQQCVDDDDKSKCLQWPSRQFASHCVRPSLHPVDSAPDCCVGSWWRSSEWQSWFMLTPVTLHTLPLNHCTQVSDTLGLIHNSIKRVCVSVMAA